MNIIFPTENFIGIWKFTNKVSISQLQLIAEELAKDDCYLSIYIRKCSREQFGIGFEYKPDLSKKEKLASKSRYSLFDKYCYETTDFLKKQTGNALIGWDIGREYFKIK